MTQTIHLESDVYAAAESVARREHRTVGAIVNQVLRRTLLASGALNSRSPDQLPPHATIDSETGFPLVKCERAFTSEDVYRAETEWRFKAMSQSSVRISLSENSCASE